MRIAHLPSSFFPDSVGGTEVYVQTLCGELERLGHKAAVVWHTAATEGLSDGAVALSPLVVRRRSHLYTKTAGQEPPGFREFLRTWQPDVVHFHAFTLGAGEDHAACCRQEHVPYVLTYHTPAMSCPRGTLLRWGKDVCDGRVEPRGCAACSLHGRGWPKALASLASCSPLPHGLLPESALLPRLALPSILNESMAIWKRFFGGAKQVIACADFCRDVLMTNGVPPEKIVVERQALPGDDRLRTLRLPLLPSGERGLRIGYFGRITVVKGPDALPALISRLRGAGISSVGEWVGPIDGGQQRWAERMFAAAAPDVRYLGIKRGEELAAWIRGCDLMVIPSRWLETGPLTLLEAWDHGTPVIGADRGGIRDFMVANDLPQCLFAVDDIAAMVEAVRRLLAWNGPAPVVCVPGMHSLAERMIDIYDRDSERVAAAQSETCA